MRPPGRAWLAVCSHLAGLAICGRPREVWVAWLAALRNGRHQHQPINDIIKELASLQIKHKLKLNPAWVRRCYNDAADALSKNDMPRFGANVQGNRSRINLSSDDLALPETTAIKIKIKIKKTRAEL